MVFIGENDIKKAAEKSAANLVNALLLRNSGYRFDFMISGVVIDITAEVINKIINGCFAEAEN